MQMLKSFRNLHLSGEHNENVNSLQQQQPTNFDQKSSDDLKN